jgi:hypothetical protein
LLVVVLDEDLRHKSCKFSTRWRWLGLTFIIIALLGSFAFELPKFGRVGSFEGQGPVGTMRHAERSNTERHEYCPDIQAQEKSKPNLLGSFAFELPKFGRVGSFEGQGPVGNTEDHEDWPEDIQALKAGNYSYLDETQPTTLSISPNPSHSPVLEPEGQPHLSLNPNLSHSPVPEPLGQPKPKPKPNSRAKPEPGEQVLTQPCPNPSLSRNMISDQEAKLQGEPKPNPGDTKDEPIPHPGQHTNPGLNPESRPQCNPKPQDKCRLDDNEDKPKRGPGAPRATTGSPRKLAALSKRRARKRRSDLQFAETGRRDPPGRKRTQDFTSKRTDAQRQQDRNSEIAVCKTAMDTVCSAWTEKQSISQEGIQSLLTASTTRTGKRKMKPLHAMVAAAENGKKLAANITTFAKLVAPAHRAAAILIISDDIPAAYFQDLTDIDKNYIWGIRHKAVAGEVNLAIFTETNKTGQVRPPQWQDVQADICLTFFERNSSVKSGGQVHQIFTTFHELEARLYADWPRLLREYTTKDPSILKLMYRTAYRIEEGKSKGKNKKKHICKFVHACITAADAADPERHPHFDTLSEYKSRKLIADKVYLEKLSEKSEMSEDTPALELESDQSFLLKSLDSLQMVPADVVAFKIPVRHGPGVTRFIHSVPIQPPTQATFFKLLKKKKVRWNLDVNPTTCPIHDSGPMYESLLKQMREDLTANTTMQHECRTKMSHLELELQNCKVSARAEQIKASLVLERQTSRTLTDDKLVIKAKLTEYDIKVTKYHTHLKQYETARAKVKEVEKELVPGQCLVYRDFVNQHSGDSKICDLIFVVIWREEVNGPFHIQKINNFCSDKTSRGCDAWFMKDVWEFHMNPQDTHHSGLFDKFHTIFLSGDHGPHFSAIDTIINESKWSTRSKPNGEKIRIHLLFLCSYHAYNRCDGAGAITVNERRRLEKLGMPPSDAGEMAIAMDKSRHRNVQSWPFSFIDRSVNVFPWKASKKISAQDKLRDKCEIRFDFIDEAGQISTEFGVALVRDIPGSFNVWNYLVVDLLQRTEKEKMCKGCSNLFQRPVRHHGTVCTAPSNIVPLGNPEATPYLQRRTGYLLPLAHSLSHTHTNTAILCLLLTFPTGLKIQTKARRPGQIKTRRGQRQEQAKLPRK